jgi:glycosyltransferase involved in cell wall biosynthesis
MSVNLAGRGVFERWQQRTSIRRLYPLADCVLVPSAGVAQDLAQYTGLPRGHIQVLRSPIVTPELRRQALEPVSHPWLEEGAGVPVVLGVGELGHRKDFETLVRAFALVRQRRPCRLVILGRGRRRDALLDLARQLGLHEDVDLPGFHPNPYAFMARSRLFVLSSRWEGMPVVLIEALAAHTPVVSTDCPSGPQEILGAHPVGALVPVGDEAAMAAAIAEWLARSVPAAHFENAIAEYRVEASARAYLRALGLPQP